MKVTGEEELKHGFAIRRKVFVEEQHVAAEDEYDGYEEHSVHFLALVDGTPAGAARWRVTSNGIKLERFAVLKSYRNKGVGTSLVKAVLADVSKNGTSIYLHSQLDAVSLYSRLGFTPDGPEFIEAGIRHQKMVLSLLPENYSA